VELMTLAAERIVISVTDSSRGATRAVTAKLSKRFYDVLGEDIANELVPWTSRTAATSGS
jgi:hypothetical protein